MGARLRSRALHLPAKFAVPNLSAMRAVEISGNTVGRIANKGMEGLAITPDGKMLVGAMQSLLIQDGGDTKAGVTRIVVSDADLPGFVPQPFGERGCDDDHGR
jgi:hypothetical protein